MGGGSWRHLAELVGRWHERASRTPPCSGRHRRWPCSAPFGALGVAVSGPGHHGHWPERQQRNSHLVVEGRSAVEVGHEAGALCVSIVGRQAQLWRPIGVGRIRWKDRSDPRAALSLTVVELEEEGLVLGGPCAVTRGSVLGHRSGALVVRISLARVAVRSVGYAAGSSTGSVDNTFNLWMSVLAACAPHRAGSPGERDGVRGPVGVEDAQARRSSGVRCFGSLRDSVGCSPLCAHAALRT